MDTTSYIALSRQTALRRDMDVIANNIANSSTVGFKRSRTHFTEYLMAGGSDLDLSYVQDMGTVRDPSSGALRPTGNSLDLAIQGPGYLVLQGEDGPRYTRNGQVTLGPDGTLLAAGADPTTGARQPLLGEGDRPIVIPAGTATISVTREGVVSADTLRVGKIRLAAFNDERTLKLAGNSLYTTDQQGADAFVTDGTKLMQGMLEDSNVAPVLEVVGMIDVVRSYQNVQLLIETEHDVQREAIRTITENA